MSDTMTRCYHCDRLHGLAGSFCSEECWHASLNAETPMPDPIDPDIAATLAELDRLHEVRNTHYGSREIADVLADAWPALRAHIATLTAVVEAHRASFDEFPAVQWCGVCHAPLQSVRPGKVQCVHCEESASLRREVATLTARNESLAVELRERYDLLQEHRAELLAQAKRLAEVEGELGKIIRAWRSGDLDAGDIASTLAALAKPTEGKE